MMRSHLVLGLLWIGFCFLHSALASSQVKDYLQLRMRASFRHYRLFYNLFALSSMSAIIWYGLQLHSSPVFTPTVGSRVFGGVIGFAGLTLMGWCIRRYFRGLSGLRSLFEADPHGELLITGMHQYVRHPLYLGTFAFIWGLWLCFPSWSLLISVVIITVYTCLAIRFEEEKLVKEYGEDYREYQQTVPMLLPGRRVKRKPSEGRTGKTPVSPI